jgi:triacylglycerol lipase
MKSMAYARLVRTSAVALGVSAAAAGGLAVCGMAHADVHGSQASGNSSSSSEATKSAGTDDANSSATPKNTTTTDGPSASRRALPAVFDDADQSGQPATGGATTDAATSQPPRGGRTPVGDSTDTNTRSRRGRPAKTTTPGTDSSTDTVRSPASTPPQSESALSTIRDDSGDRHPVIDGQAADQRTAVATAYVAPESRPTPAATAVPAQEADGPTTTIGRFASSAEALFDSLTSAADTWPTGPASTSFAWTVFGFARREIGQASACGNPGPQIVGTSTSTARDREANAEVSSASLSPTAGPAVASIPAAVTETAISPTPPLTWNGQPSLIHQVVATVLKLFQPILVAFNDQISQFIGIPIPFLTDGVPPFYVTGGLDVTHSEVDGMRVWTLTPKNPTGKQVVALHGGGYALQILPLQWSTYADMARDTGATVIVPIYPLIPEGTAGTVVPIVTDIVSQSISEHGAENVSLLGDSAGGAIALAAAQQLVIRGDPVPSSIVLESPWLDATVSDPQSQTIDDPFYTVATLRKPGIEWAGDLPGGAANPLASPLNGSLEGLPPIYVYTSTRDLLSPQALRLKELADSENADVTLTYREGLIHDWLIFPFFPEALAERPAIYRQLGLIAASPDN